LEEVSKWFVESPTRARLPLDISSDYSAGQIGKKRIGLSLGLPFPVFLGRGFGFGNWPAEFDPCEPLITLSLFKSAGLFTFAFLVLPLFFSEELAMSAAFEI